MREVIRTLPPGVWGGLLTEKMQKVGNGTWSQYKEAQLWGGRKRPRPEGKCERPRTRVAGSPKFSRRRRRGDPGEKVRLPSLVRRKKNEGKYQSRPGRLLTRKGKLTRKGPRSPRMAMPVGGESVGKETALVAKETRSRLGRGVPTPCFGQRRWCGRVDVKALRTLAWGKDCGEDE